MRRQHKLLAVFAAAGLLLAACGDDDDDTDTGGDGGSSAEDLTLGGPQDCESNAYCLPGLQRVYDVDLSGNFTPLDPGLVVSSLDSGDIDVGVLFSTDAVLAEGDLVVLEDDQEMSAADNIFPVATKEVADAYGENLANVLDAVSSELTTDDLIQLNKRHDIDHEDPDAVATEWLDEHSDVKGIVESPGEGPAIKIGAQDFGESQVLSQIYKQALEANGFTAETTEVGGFRDLLFGAFESGDINMAIDYVASELEYLNDNAGEATHDLDETLGLLEPLLEEQNLVAFTPAEEAINTNVFVVTPETSEDQGLTKLSDLKG